MESSFPTFIGRYRVVERLSSGGMGVLYLARDPAIDRPVAIKVARVQDAALRERFLREARATGRLRHRNIVTIFDVGEHDGEPFIAMEYVPGPTLAEIVGQNVPLPILQRLRMMRELCDGLAHAHAQGIVHRDIKPANLIAREDSGALTILDFGIARLTDSTMTGAAMLGTLHYMAPEQIDGGGVDHRCDIFSTGVVLYEMLSYRRAFDGDTPTGVMYKIVHETPTPLTELSPDLDPALIEIVSRAINKRAEDRYQRCDEMTADVEAVIRRIERGSEGPESTILIRKEDPTPPSSPGSGRIDRAVLVERRKARMTAHLEAANVAIDAERWEEGREAIEQAALLDPDDERVQQALERLDSVRTARQVDEHVSVARAHLQASALTSASEHVDLALQLQPESRAALRIRRDIEVRRSINRWLEAAERYRAAGEFSEAAQAADEVLKIEPGHEAALQLKDQAERAARDARAQVAVDDARRRCAAGDFAGAREILEGFEEPHDLLAAELASVEAAIQRKRESFELFVSRARSQLERGDLQGARDPIQEALHALEADGRSAGSENPSPATSAQVVSDTTFPPAVAGTLAPEPPHIAATSLFSPPATEGRRRGLGVTIVLAVAVVSAVSGGLWLASSGSGREPALDVGGNQGSDSGDNGREAPGVGEGDSVPESELAFADLSARPDRRTARESSQSNNAPDPTPPATVSQPAARELPRVNDILPLLSDAVAAESAGDLEDALALYDRALGIEPDNPLARSGRERVQAANTRRTSRNLLQQANAAFGAGRYADARRIFQNAFDLDPSLEAAAGLERAGNADALTCRGEAGCGRLFIRVEPAAEIIVDDLSLGTATVLELSLAAGRHRIRLETDALRFSEWFEIFAGETREFDVNLHDLGFPK